MDIGSIKIFISEAVTAIKNLPWDIIKIIFIIIDVCLLIGLVNLIPKILKYRPNFEIKPRSKKKKNALEYQKQKNERAWEIILDKSGSAPPHSLTLAVIEADSFVDNILKQLDLKGETMADRLKQLSPEGIKSLERLWQAHKIRNQLVHTPGTELSSREAQQYLKYFENFLREIEAI